MGNVIKSEKDKVAIIAAFKLKDGRTSYKGCEVYKKDFIEEFDSIAHTSDDFYDSNNILKNIYDEIVTSESEMNETAAEKLVNVVINSNSVDLDTYNNNSLSIGFLIFVDTINEFKHQIQQYDWYNWCEVKRQIINSCDGAFNEKFTSNDYQ
ncbi:MAG: hypothetical protein RL108_1311 [Bacteroidota bacterium]|jgi:hypothetical protein